LETQTSKNQQRHPISLQTHTDRIKNKKGKGSCLFTSSDPNYFYPSCRRIHSGTGIGFGFVVERSNRYMLDRLGSNLHRQSCSSTIHQKLHLDSKMQHRQLKRRVEAFGCWQFGWLRIGLLSRRRELWQQGLLQQ
jgi:hypothetical protein